MSYRKCIKKNKFVVLYIIRIVKMRVQGKK